MSDSSLTLFCTTTLRYEIRTAYRNVTELINPLLFLFMTASLFPLAMDPDPNFLRSIAPGVIWIMVLLTTFLTLERLFRAEFLDGSLEQLLLSPRPLVLCIFIKLFAHWLIFGLPLLLISPVLAIFLHLPRHAWPILFASLLLGTPILIFIGAIGRALTLYVRNSSFLMILLILPFYVPILIFGTTAVANASEGFTAQGQLAGLAALLLPTLSLAPWAAAAALKLGW